MTLITITHRTVEHNDPEAAGFVRGWWWTVETEHGYFESATATKNGSEAFARNLAASHGISPDAVSVAYGDDLMDRTDDEARVKELRGSYQPPAA